MIETKIQGFTLRYAESSDIKLILEYIIKQAIFEDEPHEVIATEEILRKSLFENPCSAKVLLPEYHNQSIGFALFHDSFSTRLGTSGIHLVDLYIDEEFRGRGFGKITLAYLGELAINQGPGRLEWWCHSWNKEAMQHYKNWGAKIVPEMHIYRLEGKRLEDFLTNSNKKSHSV